MAWAGAGGWPALLATGWLAHVGWDVLLHGPETPFVPAVYPDLCVGFDLMVAGALAHITLRRPPPPDPNPTG